MLRKVSHRSAQLFYSIDFVVALFILANRKAFSSKLWAERILNFEITEPKMFVIWQLEFHGSIINYNGWWRKQRQKNRERNGPHLKWTQPKLEFIAENSQIEKNYDLIFVLSSCFNWMNAENCPYLSTMQDRWRFYQVVRLRHFSKQFIKFLILFLFSITNRLK